MPEATTPSPSGKTRPVEHSAPAGGAAAGTRTSVAAWVTALLGAVLLADNVLELGGVGPTARELTGWIMVLLLLAHGLSVAWKRDGVEDAAGLRLPRWVLAGLPLLGWLAFLWLTDRHSPWAGQDTFFLAAQVWLLCWVVAATPGGRELSWAWMFLVAGAALAAFIVAAATQRGADALWLPLGRELPEEWRGRWSGPLPTPGSFGTLLLLGAAPLLVMAFSRRLGIPWRIIFGYAGIMLLAGAAAAFSLGVWLGIGVVLLLLPILVGHTPGQRMGSWALGIGVLVVIGGLNVLAGRRNAASEGLFGPLQAGEPSWSDSWQVLTHSLLAGPVRAGHGLPYADLSHAAGVWGNGGGLSYGWGDWLDAATSWGLVGAVLAAVALGAFLVAGWISWAKLPFLVLSGAKGGAASPRRVQKHSPTQPTYTPETKVLLAAGLLALTTAAVAMTSVRAFNVPVVGYAFAVVVGVVARNIPQRGGSWRLPTGARWALGLGPALVIGALIVWKVIPTAQADLYLDRAHHRFVQIMSQPNATKHNAKLLREAFQDVDMACKTNASSLQVSMERAWLAVAQAQLDPAQSAKMSKYGREAAGRVLKEETAPQAVDPHLACGLACLMGNKVNVASKHMRQALDIAPYDPRVQYYAVAVLALDPSTRDAAKQLVENARDGAVPQEHLRRLEAAYGWGKMSKLPLSGELQRPTPPLYFPALPWPPLHGLPRGTARPEAVPETAPEVPAAPEN